jgi:hypothetical protein
MTGAPADSGLMGNISWGGGTFKPTESYLARVKYVEGEYYWKVVKGQQIDVQDYQGLGAKVRERLSRESSRDEVIWSWGVILPASLISSAFKVTLPARVAIGDVGPTSDSGTNAVIIMAIIVFFLITTALKSCSCDDDDPDCRRGSSSSSSFHK